VDEWSKDPRVQAIIGFSIVAVGIAVVILILRERAVFRWPREAALAAREPAVIVRDTQVTSGGVICFTLLILTVASTIFAYSRAITVFQQIEADVSLISGSSILFGLGVALGRKRTFRIYPSEHRVK
jgi:hypothetical protein